MAKQYTPVFIVSAWEDSEQEFNNQCHTDELEGSLRRRGFSFGRIDDADGRTNFIVIGYMHHLEEMLDVARWYEQDSVLFVDGQRGVTRFYTDGRAPVFIGQLVSTMAKPTSSQWTYSHVTGAYYWVDEAPEMEELGLAVA